MEGQTCQICWVGTLVLDAGLLVCDTCGGTVQSYVEETQEFQTGVSDSQFFRKQKFGGSQQEPLVVKEKERPDIKGGVLAYVQAVQLVLQEQLQAVRSVFGASPAILDHARAAWEAYLVASRILEPAFAAALEATIEEKKQAAGIVSGSFRDHSIVRTLVEEQLRVTMPLSLTLAVSLLGCWQAREAVSPLDIAQAALNGQLPYLNCEATVQGTVGPFSAVLGRNLFSPAGVPGPSTLYFRAIELASTISLRCPAINAGIWLRRFIDELSFPEEIFPAALQLYNLYGSHFGEQLHLQPAGQLHPWAAIMSFVVLAVKLTCRIDGKEPVVRSSARNMEWMEWASSQFSSTQGLTAFPLESADVLTADASLLFPYLRHLRETLFAAFSPPEGLKEYQSTLLRMADSLHSPNTSVPVPVSTNGAQGEHAENGHGQFEYHGKRSMQLTAYGPEFVALLSVCAFKTWIAPDLLAEALRQLEEIMVGTEFEVAYAVDPVAQEQLAHMKEVAERQRTLQSSWHY